MASTQQLLNKAFHTPPNNLPARELTPADFQLIGEMNKKFSSSNIHQSIVIILIKLYGSEDVLSNYDNMTDEAKDDIKMLIEKNELREALGIENFTSKSEIAKEILIEKGSLTTDFVIHELKTTYWTANFSERLNFLSSVLGKFNREDRNVITQYAEISIPDLVEYPANLKDKARYLATLVKSWKNTADVSSSMFCGERLEKIPDGLFYSLWNTAGKRFASTIEVVEDEDANGNIVTKEVWCQHPHGDSVFQFLNALPATSLFAQDFSSWNQGLAVKLLYNIMPMINTSDLAYLADRILNTQFISNSLMVFGGSTGANALEERQNIIDIIDNFVKDIAVTSTLDEIELFMDGGVVEETKELSLDDLITGNR